MKLPGVESMKMFMLKHIFQIILTTYHTVTIYCLVRNLDETVIFLYRL